MAIRASADSEMPRETANSAKRCFSTRVGRAVMDGWLDEVVLLFTGRDPLVQQNADTSLSCHQNNTNSKDAVSNSCAAPDIGLRERDNQRVRGEKP